MASFIENPRRAPRIPTRCDVRIALRSGSFFTCCTVDVGPGGCGLEAAPSPLTLGERAFFAIDHEGARYLLAGRVAWSSTASPWRAGVAFDEGSHGSAVALFNRIASANPGAGRALERIPEDAILARTPVPGTLKAIPKEAEVLLAIGDGIEARALRERLGADWDERVNAVFALLERGAIEAREIAPSDTSIS